MTGCSLCGMAWRRQTHISGRKVRYWCDRCDAHGTGCQNREHPPGRCTYRGQAMTGCSLCGMAWRRQTHISGRKVRYWCDRCDAHGTGCQNREHPPGRCTYRAGV